jgi:DNA-binding transcriptional MerR regulator
MNELVAQTGVAARTIREYMRLGILPRPEGYGMAARYSREHLLRLWAIASLRADGFLLDQVKARLAQMTPRQLAKYAPRPPRAEEEEAPPPAPEPEPANEKALEKTPAEAPSLPNATRWVIAPLLPGLALMVRDDASPIVRRAAAEIAERYGATE